MGTNLQYHNRSSSIYRMHIVQLGAGTSQAGITAAPKIVEAKRPFARRQELVHHKNQGRTFGSLVARVDRGATDVAGRGERSAEHAYPSNDSVMSEIQTLPLLFFPMVLFLLPRQKNKNLRAFTQGFKKDLVLPGHNIPRTMQPASCIILKQNGSTSLSGAH